MDRLDGGHPGDRVGSQCDRHQGHSRLPAVLRPSERLISGNYDLALDNNAALASTPWSYFQRVYQLPIAKQQTAQLNWERFNSPKDWSLVQQAGTTPLS